MKQEEYRSCMAKGMSGGVLKGLSKEDRGIRFCAIAKGCAKGIPLAEALRLCSLPKPPKPPKPGGGHRRSRRAVVTCDIGHCVHKVGLLTKEGHLPMGIDPEFICEAIFKR